VAKPNFAFEKRQRDLAKKKKKDEKRQKKQVRDPQDPPDEAANGPDPSAPRD
jgi:hypothetical protein